MMILRFTTTISNFADVRNIIRRQIQMSKLEDNVNEILGIEKKAKLLKDFEQPSPVPRKIDETKDVDNDYEHSRDNYYNLIDKGNQPLKVY